MGVYRVDDCTRCPALVKKRRCIVNGEGPSDARIAFVGEGPGEYEDQKRRPFIGKAGRVLKALEWSVGIDYHQAYHTNATRCWGGRNPTNQEVDNCHDHLIAELRELQPAVIVSLGGPALRSLFKSKTSIREVMGFTVYNDELPGIPIIPTYHPSYIMRGNWGEVPVVQAHINKAKRIAEAPDWEERLGSYMGVTTLDGVRALRDVLLDPSVDFIAVDTETTGLSWMDDEILCITLSPEYAVGYSVPLLHRGEKVEQVKKGKKTAEKVVYFPTPFWSEEDWPEVQSLLHEILSSDKPKGGQNIEYDLGMLEREPSEVCTAQTAYGFEVNNVVHDTRIYSSLLFENLPANLTTLNALWCDLPYYEDEIKPFKKKMWELPDEKCWDYGAADADVVQRLAPPLRERIDAEGTNWLYENISLPLIHCANRLQQRGVYIDRDYFDRLCRYYSNEVQAETQRLNELVGREVPSPTYYQNVQKLLFKELGLPLTNRPIESAAKGPKKCKSCERDKPCSPQHAATGADALKELNERHPHHVIPSLTRLASLTKFSSTFLDGGDGKGGFAQHIRADGRIHGRWSAGRAETGRFVCEQPNLMNPPKEVEIDSEEYGIHSKDAIRAMFSAPPGYSVMNADWSQLEVWVLAYETGDPTLLDLLLSGKDVHVYVGRKLCELGVSRKFPHEAWEPELSDKEWRAKYGNIRNDAKTFTFGLSYQLTEQGAADRLGCSIEEASALFQAFLNHVFPGLPDYFARVKEEIIQTYGVRDIFGRYRHFPEVPVLGALRYHTDLESVFRQGINFPIQAGGHDLHSIAHIHTEAFLSDISPPVSEMHDSLMSEVSNSVLEEAARSLKWEWEHLARTLVLPNGQRLGWEIPVSVQWGPSFGEPEWELTAAGEISKVEQ